MNIDDLLRTQAAQQPQTPAIIDRYHGRDRITTYSELDGWAGRIAALFQKHGLTKGSTVLVFLPMGLELYAVLLALFRLDVAAMFPDPSASRKHLEAACVLAPPDALIGPPWLSLLRLLLQPLRKIPLCFSSALPALFSVPLRSARILPPLKTPSPATKEAPALITFTSGSTGIPKGISRSRGFLLEQHRVLARSIGLESGQRDLTALPVFVLANLASGVTSVIPDADLRRPGYIKPRPVLRQIERLCPDRAIGSPSFFLRLAEGAAKRGKTIGPIWQVFTGGAPVFLQDADRIRAAFPAASLVAVYGSTEAEPIALLRHEETSHGDRRHPDQAEDCWPERLFRKLR